MTIKSENQVSEVRFGGVPIRYLINSFIHIFMINIGAHTQEYFWLSFPSFPGIMTLTIDIITKQVSRLK